MRYSFKKMIYLLAVPALLTTACKKGFLNVNDDPNSVTEQTITPELLFPQASVATGARAASGNFEFLNKWLGYWGSSGSYVIDQTETTYNISFTFGENIWQNHYNVLFDLFKTEQKALLKGDSVLAGAAMVLSAKLWQELVDLYGNIPFTQAFQNSRTTTPAYDEAEFVYGKLLLKLDTAKTYLSNNPRGTFEDIDLVAHGHTEDWIRFANTLKLRLLIRQSEVPGFDPAPEITKIMDGGAELNTIKAGQGMSVNPGYVNDVAKQNPFYGYYGYTPTGTEANELTRANVYFLNLLNSTSDPRVSRNFRAPAAGGPITGVVYGRATGNPLGGASSGIGPGLLTGATSNQWIYPDFESLFLEAEAIARGWVTGNAEAVYRLAVTRSFVFLGVPSAVAEANEYLDNQDIANWANSGPTAFSKARFITYQKYIALAGVDALEAYSDLRRLDMLPDDGYLSANPGRAANHLPNRLPYPQSEYTYNSQNVTAQGNINVFTDKIFWQP